LNNLLLSMIIFKFLMRLASAIGTFFYAKKVGSKEI
jgi:hypothetical protein